MIHPVHPRADIDTPPEPAPRLRRINARGPALAGVLLAAAALRVALALAMPCLSRDGVVFCNYARDLGQRGLSLLRDPQVQQHPLYPAAILFVERVASLFGAPDTPMTWQRSGQLVSIVAGLGIVLIVGALAVRLVRELKLPANPAAVGWVAALLAAILPLNAALSADVMSDQPHALLYLLGLFLTMRLVRGPAAIATGWLAGLAFLTRPEGAAVVPAAWAAILARRGELGWRRVATLAGLVAAGFALLAGPYWALTGRISAKKSPLELLSAGRLPGGIRDAPRDPSAGELPGDRLTLARLKLVELPPYAWLPWVLYTLLRAGRVVVVAFGLAAAWHLRAKLLSGTLVGWTTAGLLHLALTTALLGRWHYLAPRHLLVVVLLLVPFAALAFVHVWSQAHGRLRPWLRGGLVGCVLVLVGYAIRIPNGADAHLRRMATWIEQHVARQPRRTLISGWSQTRVAFYAGLAFEHWSEDPGEIESLVRMIAGHERPLVLLEAGPGYERQAHLAALKALQEDPRLAGRIRTLHEEPGPAGTRLVLLEVRPAAR